MLYQFFICVAIYCLHIIGGCALAFGALATPAQQIIVTSQIADLDPGNKSSFPSDLVNVHGTLFFKANTDTFSYSLWASDGTAAGTVQVTDLNPFYLTAVNSTLFFVADDGIHGAELWKSDGTAAGTVQVADLDPGSGSSSPLYLTNVHGTLFFTVEDSTSFYRLWTSDGTAAGTAQVSNIALGQAAYRGAGPEMIAVNGTLFFRADDGTSGAELWKATITSTIPWLYLPLMTK